MPWLRARVVSKSNPRPVARLELRERPTVRELETTPLDVVPISYALVESEQHRQGARDRAARHHSQHRQSYGAEVIHREFDATSAAEAHRYWLSEFDQVMWSSCTASDTTCACALMLDSTQ